MTRVVGVVGIKIVVVVTSVAACDETVVETVIVGVPAIVVVIVSGMTRAAPSVITMVVPAVIAVRVVPAPAVIKSAVIVTVRIVVRTVVVGRPVPVVTKIDTYAPVVRVVIIPVHIGEIGVVISPAVIDVAVETTNPRRIVIVVIIIVVIIIIVGDISIACLAIIIAFRSGIVCGGGSFFRILLGDIFFGIIIGFGRNCFRSVSGRSRHILCISGSTVDIIVVRQ